ncbi:hypothetical protein D3C74_486570 [compost metagenome]
MQFFPFQITGELYLETDTEPRFIYGWRCSAQLPFGSLFEQIHEGTPFTGCAKNLLEPATAVHHFFTQYPSWSQ